MPKLLDFSQELRELGARGTLFRVQWELKGRLIPSSTTLRLERSRDSDSVGDEWTRRLPLADAPSVIARIRPLLDDPAIQALVHAADRAAKGDIIAFGRWTAKFGSPIDWALNPVTRTSWPPGANARDIGPNATVGDVKFTWEIARFPHAYQMARASAFLPSCRETWASALLEQIELFNSANEPGRGIHWTSGQEVAFRLLAWLFALDTCLSRASVAAKSAAVVADALISGATFIEDNLDYARIAVYNNHLLSEAVALFGAGVLLPDAPRSAHWRRVGREILDQESDRQFYADGGYIQQSHNYHRVALQDLLWACAFAKAAGDRPSSSWLRAMDRSLDLLIAHQSPDGRLPNYGANDGSHPSPLTTCDFSDFRPTLQAVSLATRGERVYPPGPWDEEAAWFLGAKALDAPTRDEERVSVSFPVTGYHVLRGNAPGSFAAFRCGSLRDRFSQIDMLHVDVMWRGQNVLSDAGSYSYNGSPEWHQHFMRTASHNTISVDGRDQMLHFRQFKVVYLTKAALLAFSDHQDWALCAGEHYGYQRHDGAVVHRRSVLLLKDETWIVVDHVAGTGEHDIRLHWLCGDFPYHASHAGGVTLATPSGDFNVLVLDDRGEAIKNSVVRGQSEPPRGWLSRYYGEKIAVPSIAVERRARPPLTFVSILTGSPVTRRVEGNRWTIASGRRELSFTIADGMITEVLTADERPGH